MTEAIETPDCDSGGQQAAWLGPHAALCVHPRATPPHGHHHRKHLRMAITTASTTTTGRSSSSTVSQEDAADAAADAAAAAAASASWSGMELLWMAPTLGATFSTTSLQRQHLQQRDVVDINPTAWSPNWSFLCAREVDDRGSRA